MIGNDQRAYLAVKHFKLKISGMVRICKKQIMGNKIKALGQWKTATDIMAMINHYDSVSQSSNAKHSETISSLNDDIHSLTSKQSTLEMEVEAWKKKEASSQATIQKLNDQIESDRKSIRELRATQSRDTTDWKSKCRAMENKNNQLKDKIWAMEQNVAGFISEMGGLLETTVDDDDSNEENTFDILRKKTQGGRQAMKSQSTKKLENVGINLDLGRRREYYGANIYN